MNQLPNDITNDSVVSLSCRLTPSGHIDIQFELPEGGTTMKLKSAEQINSAFERGRGNGVLHLGAAELSTDLPPSLSYWRELGKSFISRACHVLDPTDPTKPIIPDPDVDEIRELVESAPPMRGAELINQELLLEIWSELGEAIVAESNNFDDGIEGFLKKYDSVWNVVGRVCFHLAENKRDSDYPFAFVATYVDKVSKQAKPQHKPLNLALKEYAGQKNKEKLATLLAPVSRASKNSAFIQNLVEKGSIFRPLKWTPRQAHTFLQETALYEESGLVVRMPDWWSSKNKPRPMVTASIGKNEPSYVGAGSLLSFNVSLTLDGVELTQKEIKEILAASEGLVFLKGKWIEVNPELLSQVLDQWQQLQLTAQDGVSFGQAMQMLAGTDLDMNLKQSEGDRPEWSQVIAGDWLKSVLDSLHSPDLQKEIKSNAGLNAELRPYQKFGVQWLSILRTLQLGGCLADDMGLGKTIQVLGVLNMCKKNKEKGTDLLIVPASLLENWYNEAQKFAPNLKILIAHPSRTSVSDLQKLPKKKVESYDAVITTYGTSMRLPWIKEYNWRNLILDEAQAIKNSDTKQTKAVKELKSIWRLALTGTPIENRLADLWSLFDFLNPGLLSTGKNFQSFCKDLENRSHGFAPLRKLVQPYILRRLKTDKKVISDLPDKSEVRVNCSLSKHQATLYQQAVKELEKAIEKAEGIARQGIVLSYLLKFKQICNHPSQLLGDNKYDPKESGKFQQLRELCESIASRQDKVLVFSQYREITDPLARYLAEIFGQNGLILHGGTPVKKRQALVKSFQEDDRIPFMMLSLKAGGTGLNLTAASHVIHFDRWWNPSVENQATDRAFRIGQKKNVMVHKFVCKGTLEERIDQMISDKKKLSEEVLAKGTEINLSKMSNSELISMVSLDLNSALSQ